MARFRKTSVILLVVIVVLAIFAIGFMLQAEDSCRQSSATSLRTFVQLNPTLKPVEIANQLRYNAISFTPQAEPFSLTAKNMLIQTFGSDAILEWTMPGATGDMTVLGYPNCGWLTNQQVQRAHTELARAHSRER